jgi:hypothetical protein
MVMVRGNDDTLAYRVAPDGTNQKITFTGDNQLMDADHETAVRNLFDIFEQAGQNSLDVRVKGFTGGSGRRAMYFAGTAFNDPQKWRQSSGAWLCADSDGPAIKCARAKWFHSAPDSKLLEDHAQSIVDRIEKATATHQDSLVISGKDDSFAAIFNTDEYMFLKNDHIKWSCEGTFEGLLDNPGKNPVPALLCDYQPDRDKKIECLTDYVVALSAGADLKKFRVMGRPEHVICPSQ